MTPAVLLWSSGIGTLLLLLFLTMVDPLEERSRGSWPTMFRVALVVSWACWVAIAIIVNLRDVT